MASKLIKKKSVCLSTVDGRFDYILNYEKKQKNNVRVQRARECVCVALVCSGHAKTIDERREEKKSVCERARA